MLRDNLQDILMLRAVAEAGSFTRAAARLGLSQSALSHAVRGLEERLGVRLLARTTRSVAPTEAGARLISAIGPHLDGIEAELLALSDRRDRPAGTIRLTTSEYPARAILLPALRKLLPAYPDVRVEISVDHSLRDIVADRFDAGIRLGERVEKDMIAVPISPETRMVVVASPDYFSGRQKPGTPYDLAAHNCINLRMATLGGLYAWEFEQAGQALNLHVDGQLILNTGTEAVEAAIAGLGIASVPFGMAEPAIADGRLVSVLEEWCEPFPGYFLYYPSRRQQSPAFSLFIEALRYRG